MPERYILRYRGGSAKPTRDVERIRASAGVKVLDSSPRMLLVEAAEAKIVALVEGMPGWSVTRERSVKLPDPRPKIRRGPPGGS